MRGMFLPVAIGNSEFTLARSLPALASGVLDELGELLQICGFFRQRGTCSLLLEGSADRWHLNNMQSAAAFLFRLPQLPADHKVTSWTKPMFDCVASHYWDAARSIAQHSRATWNPNYEYEDDFAYVRFLIEHLLLDAPAAQAEATLETYTRALEGGSDVRLDICHALLERDADEFDAGLHTLMTERAEQAWALVERAVITDDPSTWFPHVSVEGLALLAFADHIGLATKTDYPACPQLARRASPFVFDAHAWRQLEFTPQYI